MTELERKYHTPLLRARRINALEQQLARVLHRHNAIYCELSALKHLQKDSEEKARPNISILGLWAFLGVIAILLIGYIIENFIIWYQ